MKLAVALAAASLGIAFGASASQASAPAPIIFAADRAPTVTGEIYRVDPNGHVVDLSNSPYQDTDPAVSSDGSHVAFISNRAGGTSVYEEGIDGRGLVNLGQRLPRSGYYGPLAWQPDGSLLAAGSSAGTYILERGHKPVFIRTAGLATGQPWSSDGRVLLLETSGEVSGVSPTGRALWTKPNDCCYSGWSSTGLIAGSVGRTVTVYDEAGHARLKFNVPTPTGDFGGISWSPSGSRLAVIYDDSLYNQKPKLQVRTSSGRVLLRRKRLLNDAIVWARDSRIVDSGVGTCYCQTVGINVRTGTVSPASNRWFDPLSPDRTLAIVTPPDDPGFALGVAPPASGPESTYLNVPGCYSDGGWIANVASPQFAGRSLVYASGGWCDPPFANLYSVVGSTIHRLTNDQAQETQPAVSPDGTEIAYVWASRTGMSCKGCADGIRIASTSGEPIRTLTDPDVTNPDDCLFDDSPSWSPDGSTILFSESSCNSGGELFTISAAGGAPHDLGIAGTNPVWGPTRIAYVAAGGLWTANPDGSNPTKVASKWSRPAWSATGTLAYLVGASTVVVGDTQVHLPFAVVSSLAWSPDGTQFVVVARKTKTGFPDVYTVKTDGTDPVRLTKYYDAISASAG
jgi:Tol biopolymer transport system component